MTGKRKPRQPGRVNPFAFQGAINTATKLTPGEIASVIEPLNAAARALREGVADEDQWSRVVSAINVAQAIERQGVVRGLREHLHCAELALQGIRQRAVARTGEWDRTALYYQELDHINEAVDLHAFQLSQLSYGEYARAIRYAVGEIQSTGGVVIHQLTKQHAAAGAGDHP